MCIIIIMLDRLTYIGCYSGLHEFWGHPGEEELEGRAAQTRQLAGRRLAAEHIAQLHEKKWLLHQTVLILPARG